MAEFDFERRLERLFSDPPGFPDAEAFARKVEQRLDRSWDLRRGLIGAAGVAGVLVGVSQLLMSGVFQRVESAGASVRAVSASLAVIGPAQWISALPSDGGVVWMAFAVAVVTTGFVLTRVIEEI